MKKKRCLSELPALLDIGTYGIQSLKNTEKASEWYIGKVLKSMSKILSKTKTLLQERKPLKKSLSLMFIHCHIVLMDDARMKIICTVLLKYGQHSIHLLSI